VKINARKMPMVLTVCALLAGGTAHAVSMLPGSPDKAWESVQKAGTDALDANQYWRAEPLLKEAVVKAGSFGFNDLRLSKSLGELGRLYSVRGRFKEAEPYLEEELRIKREVLGDLNEKVVPAMGQLDTFYLTNGTRAKADPLTEDILSIVEGKLRETRPESSGKVVFKKGQALEAWAGEAAQIMRDPLLEWAITCDALGNVYRSQQKYEMADRLYKAALETKTTVLGKQHLSLANSYDSLGTLCLDKKQYSEAESYFRDALEQTERILPGGNPQVWQRMDKLAKCLISEGKYSEAEGLYKRALGFWKNEPAKNGEDARVYFALGCLYTQEKRYSEAAGYLHRALELAEINNGPISIGLVPYLQQYAYTLYYLGRRGETDYLRARANNISGG